MFFVDARQFSMSDSGNKLDSMSFTFEVIEVISCKKY
jgi:hypothetical protein